MAIFYNDLFDNLILLEFQGNGAKGTALFDTGAGMSLVTESFARKCGASSGDRSVKGGNNSGAVIEFPLGTIKSLKILGRVLNDVIVGILPDSTFDFGKDDNGNLFPADMFLGWDIISKFAWKFEMMKKSVEIHDGGTMENDHTLKWNQFALIDVMHEGTSLTMGIDTGHTGSMLSPGVGDLISGARQSVDTIIGIGSSVEANVKIIPEMAISICGKEIILNNVDVLDGDIPGSCKEMKGLLGIDVLAGAIFEIDSISEHFEMR